jgi:transposase InsO family protein
MALLQKELEERPTAERSPTKLGEAVGLSRSTIFRHLHSSSSTSGTNNEVELRGQIQSIALEMRSYGYRPITKELHRRGVKANHKRVLRLLREDNLLCLRQRAFVRTTDSNHSCRFIPTWLAGWHSQTSINFGFQTLLTSGCDASLFIWTLSWTLTVAAALAGRSRATSIRS